MQCFQKDASINNRNALEAISANCENANNISRETAILIAEGMTHFDYDLRDFNVEAEDEGNTWKVKFIYKKEDENRLGGSPTVWVSKKNGEILNGAFPK